MENVAGDGYWLYHITHPLSLDIRGWQEMHPLNSVGWSLFFEYIANILYAIGIRKLSKTALAILVLISAVALAHLAITSPNGDVSGGWTLNMEQLRIGFTRTMYPFFAGLLLSRVTKATRIKYSFLYCSLLLAIVLYMPRIGGAENLWMNGVYESICIIIIFPLLFTWKPAEQHRHKESTGFANFLAISPIHSISSTTQLFIFTSPGSVIIKG
ncbi:acyltransferase family protein [Sphingobacterium sp. E70]|uniref:acyltransferase family protein n=1 Tax=Sphingobacterium sp. E70 TaxID=2853439 RepID=UPI00359C6917